MGRLVFVTAALVCVFSLAPLANAQGVLVNVEVGQQVALPRPVLNVTQARIVAPPVGTYRIKQIAVEATIKDQIARTQVSQSFVNTGSTQLEVCFVFPLPYDGAIEQLTLLVDGKEFPARLLPAAEARQMYESIVRKNKDPALLEWLGNGLFKTSVFPVPPGAERKVTLRYSQLCRKDQNLTDFVFPLATAKYTSQPLESLDVRVTIESGVDIKSVYSPSHAVDVQRSGARHATVRYTASNQIPTADFRLLYDVAEGDLGASVVSYRPDSNDDGYFLLLASPRIKAPDAPAAAKTVLFVLDRSGSMTGEKFEQARGALKFVLRNLKDGDSFNIVAYDSQVESFRPELQKVDQATRQSAISFVDGLYAGGSTNISGALQAALAQLKDPNRSSLVLFLTDGLPTDGEKNEGKIVSMVKASNSVRARIFAFGVGYDVNSRLVDRLARENFGQTEYVAPSANIEASVSSLYRRISAPVLRDAKVSFTLDSGSPGLTVVNRHYPAELNDLFAGQQMVMVGRYRQAGAAKVVISGKVGDKDQSFDFPGTFVEKSNDQSQAFIEKLWAVRRIGQLLDEIDLKGRNEELVKELVQLSTRHGVLTPYTSFIADENGPRNLAEMEGRASESLSLLQSTSGEQAFRQRDAKAKLGQATQAMPSARPLASNRAGGASRAYESAGPTDWSNADFGIKYDKEEAAERIQSAGRRTFYQRGKRWVDGSLTKEQEAKAIAVKRYSKEYFELVKQADNEEGKYLAIDGPLLVEIKGQAYAID